jgi:AcrR family transcriptional regulator
MPIRPDIVRAAAAEFSRQGYDKASLEDIAERVGIRKASLYHHIRSKEDLLFAIHEDLILALIANTNKAVAKFSSPEHQLRAFVRESMRLIAEHRAEVTVFLHERHVLSSDRWKGVVKKRDRYQSILETIIANGIAEGSFRPLKVKVVTLGILGMTNWGYQWYQPDQALTYVQIADIFTDLVLAGLSSQSGKVVVKGPNPNRRSR